MRPFGWWCFLFAVLCAVSPVQADLWTTRHHYRITARETTVYLARFNNIGTQMTVLISQNASGITAGATCYFWNPDGLLLGFIHNALASKAVAAIITTHNPALAGQAGSITIAHTAPYGTWNAKAVADPTTGLASTRKASSDRTESHEFGATATSGICGSSRNAHP